MEEIQAASKSPEVLEKWHTQQDRTTAAYRLQLHSLCLKIFHII